MNRIFIFFQVLILFFEVSCNYNGKSGSLERTDKNVIYEVDLSLDPELPHWMGNIDSKKFMEMLLEKVKSGKLTAYSPLSAKPEPITWSDIEYNLGVRTDTAQTIDESTGKLTSKVMKNEINTNELKRLIFIEEWTFDESTLQFNKKILALAPVRVFTKENFDSPLKSIAFVVYFTDSKPSLLGD
jgi:glycosidase